VKQTIVGGGSTYTPGIVDGLVRLRHQLGVGELALHDISADRLGVLGVLAAMSRRMLAASDHPAAVTTHTDIASAADGADVVLVQLRVGGQTMRLQDETLPLRCDFLGQETTGAGGLAKALRTAPVMLDVAEQVRVVSPSAWLVDFTNPVGIVTRAGLAPAALAQAHGVYYLAGADLPFQVGALREAIAAHQVVSSVEVGNDAWALLRLGAPAATPSTSSYAGPSATRPPEPSAPGRCHRDVGPRRWTMARRPVGATVRCSATFSSYAGSP